MFDNDTETYEQSTETHQGEWMCPNCGDTVDMSNEEIEPWECAHCGTEMEPQSKTDVTPNDELRALIEQWKNGHVDFDVTQDAPYQAIRGCADELESVIDGGSDD